MGMQTQTIFDFSNEAAVEAWSPLNDVVMGGRSSSKVLDGGGFLRFEGDVSLENGGGFASMRCDVELDLADRSGLLVRARGDGKTYKLGLYDETGARRIAHRFGFEASHEWQDIYVRFDQLNPEFRGRDVLDASPLDASNVRGISVLIADKQAGAFEIELESILAVDGRP